MKPVRLTWIDYAKGIAILLVIYRHVFEGIKLSGASIEGREFLEYANIFLFSFRMPLFFIISGVFISKSLGKKGLGHYTEDRARTVLYPYFVWGALHITLQMIFTRYTNGHPDAKSYLYLFYLPRELAHFWYLYALFNVSVLYAFSKQVLRVSATTNVAIGLVLYFLSSYTYRQHIETGFIGDIMHYYLFISIGDWISGYVLESKLKEKLGTGISILILLPFFLLAQYYFLTKNLEAGIDKYMFVEYFQPAIFLLIALVGSFFILNLTFFLQRLDRLKFLTYIGSHSLQIYVAHVMCFAAVRIVMTRFLHINDVVILLICGIIAGATMPLIIDWFANKLNMRWIFSLDKKSSIKKA